MVSAGYLQNVLHKMPFSETVTLTSRDKADTGTAVTGINAVRLSFGSDPARFAELNVPPEAVVWYLPATELDSNVPKQGDLISDEASVDYTIRTVNERRTGSTLSHYMCATFARNRE